MVLVSRKTGKQIFIIFFITFSAKRRSMTATSLLSKNRPIRPILPPPPPSKSLPPLSLSSDPCPLSGTLGITKKKSGGYHCRSTGALACQGICSYDEGKLASPEHATFFAGPAECGQDVWKLVVRQ